MRRRHGLTGEETRMIRLAAYAAFVAALMTSGAALVSAQVPGNQPIVGISLTSSTPVVAKVAGIDPSGETVTLVSADGTTVTRKVSSLVKNLGQLKVGDTVIVSYKQRLSFVVSEPNAKTPPSDKVVAAVAVSDPQQTVGAAAAQNVRNFYVVAANPAAKTISAVDSNGGEVRTFSVSDEVAQAELPLMKPGYKLTVIDAQAMVAAIEKQV
jgi:hypothetical protein